MDWTRGDIRHELRVMVCDPNTFKTVGQLTGVSGGKLSLDYYADTRASGSIETVNRGADGWNGTGALRLYYDTYDGEGERVYGGLLFTGYVKALEAQTENGLTVRKYTLASTLWALENDFMGTTYMDAGLSVRRAITHVMDGRGHSFLPSCPDGALRTARVIEPGTSRLSALYDLCDAASLQMSVEEGGIVTFDRYVNPASRAADYDAGKDAGRGDVIAPIKTSDATLDLYSGYMVYGKKSDTYVYGTADRSGGRASRAVRGYRHMGKASDNDLAPFTNGAAAARARQLLGQDNEIAEMSHGLLFRPLRVGAIERYWSNGAASRWLVKSADLTMTGGVWTWKLDLKGGWK